uniref:Sensory neuron membrane protein 1 n=1 Tax=Megaselia scalaris TaxID=36166 RepID=T1GSC9_MEGSC
MKRFKVSTWNFAMAQCCGGLNFRQLSEHGAETWNRDSSNVVQGPFCVDFLIYVFNVTNPDAVIAGGKPIVQEIGPYYFEEWKDKFDFEDDDEEDTVTYNMRNTFIFRPDLSWPLNGEEKITIPHPMVQVGALAVKKDKEALLEMVSAGLKIIFGGKAYLTDTFLNIFFKGFFVDCSSQEFEAVAICSAFYMGEVKQATQVNATHFLLSFMGTVNGSSAGRFTVCRGAKNYKKIGQVVLLLENLKWMSGMEKAIVINLDEGVWAFAPDLCRSLGATAKKDVTYAKMPAVRYSIEFGDIKADPSQHCLCDDPEDPETCPPKGTFSIFKCVGAPMIISLPHFYAADPKLAEDIGGLHPNEEDHAISMDFELTTGTPFYGAKRLQFNLEVQPVEQLDEMKKMRKMIVPLFWVEESAALNKTWTDKIKPLFL